MGKSSLAPGFRFKPTDVELVQYYLKRKLLGKRLSFKVIAEVDIYKYDPWDLPDKSCWESGDLKWYFFCPREKKYRNGNRIQRATEGGYWKTTGKDRSVVYSGEVVGWIRTLIFHTGRAPRGDRTNWVMHEYRLEDQGLSDRGMPLDSYVICMIFQKDGLGPKIGAQYGAPFKEEDWTDDEAEICSEAIPHENMSEPNLVVQSNCNSSITTSRHSPKGIHTSPSESCISDVLPPYCNVHQLVSSKHVTMEKLRGSNDDILSMLNCFTEGSTSLMKENDKNEELGNVIASGNASATPNFNSDDIYEDLGDLGQMARVSEDGYNFSNVHNSICAPAQMQLGDNEQFLELDDLSW